tara:strand:+ start:18 stop:635 length:618 start_codon:yes stop_codon:yes gene_type:complete
MKKLTVMIVLLFCFSQSLMAAGKSAGYVGGSIGITDHDTTIGLGTATLDEEDVGWKFNAGVNVTEFLAVEFQYADFGSSTLNGVNGSTFTRNGEAFVFNTTAQLDADADSLGFSVIAGYGINEYIKPFVKLGGHVWDLAINQTAATPFGSGTIAADDGFDIFYGAGLQVNINDEFSAILEVEQYQFGSNVLDSVNLISAGILIRF